MDSVDNEVTKRKGKREKIEKEGQEKLIEV